MPPEHGGSKPQADRRHPGPNQQPWGVLGDSRSGFFKRKSNKIRLPLIADRWLV
jgi:hypothetical protein